MIKETELEQYFIYGKPVPYITNNTKKRKKFLEEEISKIESMPLPISEIEEYLKNLKQELSNIELQVIYIYPVKMTDYLEFFISANCLMIEKNKIPDPNIIKMSYLDFLFHAIKGSENGQTYLVMLFEIFKLCLNIDHKQIRYVKDEKDKINLILNLYQDDVNLNITIDKQDFDDIKKIILLQNIPDYDDTYIDPKVEAALKEAEEFMNKNKKKMASLEDQIVCVMIALHETDEKKIHNLTIRKFSKILQRYDHELHYKIYKQAECSGMVTFKEDIDHWMSEITHKKYSDVITEYGEFKKKINSANTKK